MPQIEVTFDIDANGILHVSAKDLGTGKEQKITITASSGLTKDEIEKMRRDAEAHAEDDKKRREAVETRNGADAAVYETEKLLKEHGAKVSADKKAKVEAAVAELKDAIKAEDADRMKSALEKTNTEMQAVSAELYAQARAKSGPGAGGGSKARRRARPARAKRRGASRKGDVIDADFEVVDDEKRRRNRARGAFCRGRNAPMSRACGARS